jgi:hypothetical protein
MRRPRHDPRVVTEPAKLLSESADYLERLR